MTPYSIPKLPSRPFRQGSIRLCEHSCGLVERANKIGSEVKYAIGLFKVMKGVRVSKSSLCIIRRQKLTCSRHRCLVGWLHYQSGDGRTQNSSREQEKRNENDRRAPIPQRNDCFACFRDRKLWKSSRRNDCLACYGQRWKSSFGRVVCRGIVHVVSSRFHHDLRHLSWKSLFGQIRSNSTAEQTHVLWLNLLERPQSQR